MASGGMGDVLTGMIAGFWARYEPFLAACLGVFVHGAAADSATEGNTSRGLLASDVVARVPEVIGRIEALPGAGMVQVRLTSPSEACSLRLGACLGEQVEEGDVFALWGDLGSGKTLFTRGLARAWASRRRSPSPAQPSPSLTNMTVEGTIFTIWTSTESRRWKNWKPCHGGKPFW